ncbi:MAG: hypothetical protein IJC71_08505 [Clostridia bacterium]|nr:hypothetical protein [Clostridia bacterium]
MLTYYKENWEETKNRFAAYWDKENTDRCCLSIRLGKSNGNTIPFEREYTIEERYNNPQYLYTSMVNACEHTEFLYESVPSQILNFGTAGHCQFFGSIPNYVPGTIWFDPVIREPDVSLLKYDESAFRRQMDTVSELVRLVGKRYLVGMNDNCGIVDALAHLRGSENLLFDMIEEKEFVHAAIDKITAVWKETQKAYFEAVKDNNAGGSSHSWMQLWSPARHLQIQCDYSVMISPAMFEEFVLPELEETSSAFEHTTYHLDGVEQLRHLDMILSVKGIDNIQWTRVAGQPKTSASIEALRKIQKAGKGLVLLPHKDEIEFLMQNLSPIGLQLIIGGVKDREEAAAIEKRARELARSQVLN